MSHSQHNSATLLPPDISPEEIQAELATVLRSSAFERSERLQKFLRFICDLTLRGEGGRINEYLIGSEVFLRGPEYSPSEDSVVRRQAHTLRQKLQEFYAADGRSNSIRIELPVGRYVPAFRRAKGERPQPSVVNIVEAPAPIDAVPVPTPVAARRNLRYLIAIAAASLLAIGYGIGSRSAASSENAVTPAIREFWEPWRQAQRRTVICFSSPMTAVIKRFDKELPLESLPKRYRAHPEDEELFRKTFRTPSGGAFYFTPAINQTKSGEAVAGVHLATVLTRFQIPIHTTQSRFVSWEDLRADDMILLGNNEANSWLDPLLGEAPFRLTPSEGIRQRAIVNTKPRPGESAEYVINYGVGERDGDQEFALISLLPGSTSNQRQLLISGLNAQATEAAAEYLSAEPSLADLLARLRREAPLHTGPWQFQAILKAEVHDKVPTKTWLIAVRVL